MRVKRKIADYELAVDKGIYYPVDDLLKIRNEYHTKDSPMFMSNNVPSIDYQFGKHIYVGDNFLV